MRSPILSFPGEAAEQGDADVPHALGLRDHDGAPPEPRQPMPLAGVVPLDAMRLLLARVQLSNWQEHAIDGVVVRTVQPCAPAPQALEQASQVALSRPPHSQSTSCPEARSQAFQ